MFFYTPGQRLSQGGLKIERDLEIYTERHESDCAGPETKVFPARGYAHAGKTWVSQKHSKLYQTRTSSWDKRVWRIKQHITYTTPNVMYVMQHST